MSILGPFDVNVSGSISTDWVLVWAQVISVLVAGLIGYFSAVFTNRNTEARQLELRRKSVRAALAAELSEADKFINTLLEGRPTHNFVPVDEIAGLDSFSLVYVACVPDIGLLEPEHAALVIQTYSNLIREERAARQTGSASKQSLRVMSSRINSCLSLLLQPN